VSTPLRNRGDHRFQLLFQRVGTGIAVANVEGRFLDVNPAFCATVGYTPDELAGTTVLALTHPDDRPRNSTLLEELFDGRRDAFTIEKRYLTKAGPFAWVRAHVSLIDDEHGEPQLVATTEDITAQKRTEARLEESEALLRIAGRVGRVGGWAIDVDTEPMTLYWSDELHDLAGYPRGRTPPLHEALARHPQPDREKVTDAVRACVVDGVPFDMEVDFLPIGREMIRTRLVGEPHRGDDGTVTRLQGAFMDVSEQRRAQQQTDLLTERLRTTMESITDALYTIDNDWRFDYLNARAEEVLERRAADLIGRTVWESFPEVMGSELEDGYRRAIAENRTVVLEEYHNAPLERYFSVNIYPSSQGLAVYFRDVTDRRTTRVELEERGARLAQQAALLEAAQDAIVVRDLAGTISYWNRSAERIYGWSADQAIGRRLEDLLAIDGPTYAMASRQLLQHGRWVDELETLTAGGRRLIVEARWTLVRDEQGHPVSVLGIDTDITDRKRIEQQFLRSQRFESIGKLAGGIAHDLNNALAPIALSIELLRDGEEDVTKLRMLDIIGQSAKHGAELVSQVLSFARGVDGKREPIAVGDVIDEVRRISADTFPKGITVDADVPEALWPVVGDPTQLQQVLVNLCVNARDAMPEGGTMRLTASNSRLDTSDTPDTRGRPAVAIRVIDTGVGISEEVVEKMFEPFFSTKPRAEGTGLGLSTSAVIVASHGGRIDVTTEPGVGTTFEIHLPAEWAPTDVLPPAPTPPREGANDLVLLVDDEPAIRALTCAMLEQHGYRVLDAADGREALQVLSFHGDGIAVVITDLMMPELDGYAVIDAMQRLDPAVPVIASSGLNTSEATERALRAGASRFVAKPYEAGTLLRAIGEVLDHRAGPPRP
jgi:two-component system, cell cycle sensor histidine kinase and response regulator CckA